MSQIKLNGMEFHVAHGYYSNEQKAQNVFSVDVCMDLDLEKCAASNDLNDTIDYEEVYRLCSKIMTQPQQLIEVLLDLVGSSLMDHFPKIDSLYVQITKKRPATRWKAAKRKFKSRLVENLSFYLNEYR